MQALIPQFSGSLYFLKHVSLPTVPAHLLDLEICCLLVLQMSPNLRGPTWLPWVGWMRLCFPPWMLTFVFPYVAYVPFWVVGSWRWCWDVNHLLLSGKCPPGSQDGSCELLPRSWVVLGPKGRSRARVHRKTEVQIPGCMWINMTFSRSQAGIWVRASEPRVWSLGDEIKVKEDWGQGYDGEKKKYLSNCAFCVCVCVGFCCCFLS